MIQNCLILGYIDPGTGSLLLQTLIAGLLGLLFYFRAVLRKVIAWLFRRNRDDKDQDQTTTKP